MHPAGQVHALLVSEMLRESQPQPMQACELEISRPNLPCERQNMTNSPRIMGGKLRVGGIQRFKKLSGAGEITDIRVATARENREVSQSGFLGLSNFRIPAGAFDQSDKNATPGASAQINKKIYDS